jgi:group I intron endonuclease
MPYKIDICGIYKIVNTATGQCYVGQSQRVKKRLKEHFRLLRGNKHNESAFAARIQQVWRSFFFMGSWRLNATTRKKWTRLENAFISGAAWFEEKTMYNIADFAKAPMRGKEHSEEVRQRIRLGRRASSFNYQSLEYRDTLSKAQMARYFADPKFVAKVKFILDNPDLSYAERARRLQADISPVRKLALKYQHLKGVL